MKTLILFGSSHTDGDTAALTNALTAKISGVHRLINCYTADIAPCADCRCCRERLFCPIDDEMQEVYEYLTECDNVVIASPVHYAELSAMLMKVVSRLGQSYCVIGGKTVWYSGGELFGADEDECVLRIEDEVLAGN